MRRRQVLTLAGAAATWPIAADAQRASMPRLGVLMSVNEDHPEAPSWVDALKDGLRSHRWVDGRTIQIDVRFGGSDRNLLKRHADELVALKPDVVFGQGVVGAAAMKQATQTIPVVFVQVQDPIESGFLTNITRPDGNLTGFTNLDYSVVGKWLQLLKSVSPGVSRVMLLMNPGNRPRWNGYAAAMQTYAQGLGITPHMGGIHNAADVEREIVQFAGQPNGGMVMPRDATVSVHVRLIIELAARHRLPAVYSAAWFARSGGLMGYGDSVEGQYRSAASYVDRLLRGARISDLPVQAMDRFETAINLKTAAQLGITIPATLLAGADELIE
jgi:putative ABC transport system substrate-binding protein